MRKLIIVGLAVVVALSVSAGYAATIEDYNHGTRTIKLDLNLASAGVTGTDHNSLGAVKTTWVAVPVGIPFTIYVESQDADSTTAFGPDSVHIGLETVPAMSLAALNPGAYRNRPVLLWSVGDENFTNWAGTGALTVTRTTSVSGPQAHYFQWVPGDTSFQTVATAVAAIDTLGFAATSLKNWSVSDMQGGGNKVQNLGLLRFSMCMGDDDSTADAAINIDCYIIYREDYGDKRHSSIFDDFETVRGSYTSLPSFDELWGDN